MNFQLRRDKERNMRKERGRTRVADEEVKKRRLYGRGMKGKE